MAEPVIDEKTVRKLGARIDREQGSAWRFGSKLKLPKKERDFALAMSFPSLFAKIILEIELSEQQARAADACRMPGAMVSVMAGNGAGKTSSILPAVALWHQFCFGCGITKITSGSYTQIEEQIYPNLLRFKSKFPQWKWFETPFVTTYDEEHPGREGFISCFTTNIPGRAEGHHNSGKSVHLRELMAKGKVQDPKQAAELQELLKDGGDPIVDDGDFPLLYIVDECKTAMPWLEGVIVGRVRPARLLVMSSPGFAEGWFWKTQTQDALPPSPGENFNK